MEIDVFMRTFRWKCHASSEMDSVLSNCCTVMSSQLRPCSADGKWTCVDMCERGLSKLGLGLTG